MSARWSDDELREIAEENGPEAEVAEDLLEAREAEE